MTSPEADWTIRAPAISEIRNTAATFQGVPPLPRPVAFAKSPLIPAILPAPNSMIAAAMPIINPPINPETGIASGNAVKCIYVTPLLLVASYFRIVAGMTKAVMDQPQTPRSFNDPTKVCAIPQLPDRCERLFASAVQSFQVSRLRNPDQMPAHPIHRPVSRPDHTRAHRPIAS